MEARELERLETEAVARITWGDAAADVRAWLVSRELSDIEAEKLLRGCLRRRAREMRLLGLRNLIRGGCAALGATLLGFGGWLILEWLAHRGIRTSAGMWALIFAPAMLAGGYGCWQLWLAFDRLVFGSWADGAVSDFE